MPGTRFNYAASTYDSDTHVATLNREIESFCKRFPLSQPENKDMLISMLLRRSGGAAAHGVNRGEGGPFGALLVDFNDASGTPKVIGYGTNHVVPDNDPTAHAEMTAIRDAAKRTGKTDFSGMTLLSSCECCPMCLSAATGCKVDKIYFGADRKDAAKAGFADDDQYRLMTQGGIELHGRKATVIDKIEERLNGHDAVVEIPHEGKTLRYYAERTADNKDDPTNIAGVRAIRAACAGYAAQLGQPVFHLPEGSTLITRNQPHPLTLVAADWARIGRKRGTDPLNPAHDAPDKDTNRMLYQSDSVEFMPVRDKDGKISTVDPEAIWMEIANPAAQRHDHQLQHAKLAAFNRWEKLINAGETARY